MPLNFRPWVDPETYLSYRDRAERPSFDERVSKPLLGGINALSQNQQTELARRRQAMLDQILQDKELRDRQEQEYKYGRTPDPSMMVDQGQTTVGKNPFMPNGGVVSQRTPMDQAINEYRSGGFRPEQSRPEFQPFLSEEERKFQREQPSNLADIEYKKAQAEVERQKAENLKRGGSIFGKAPAGYRYDANGNLEPIPGGPADLKTRQEQQKSDLARDSQIDQANLAITKIDQALSKISGWNTGGMASTKNIPFVGQATGAVDLDSDLQTIKSLLGFEQLAKMKEQSKAGASGLGALSNQEMTLLISARANLEQAQNAQQLRDRLNEVKTHYGNWLKIEKGINPYQNGGNTPPPGTNTSTKPIVQRNKRTGKIRTSYDGGQTWQ